MNLTGIWTGEYSFDSGAPAVAFTLTIRQDWLLRLRGGVLDGAGGMPEAGVVEGWTLGKRMRFRKLMPVARVAAEAGTRTLREHLALTSDHVLTTDPPHPPIHYEGHVATDARFITGRWTIPMRLVALADGTHALRIGGNSGSWRAHRT
jgi:hypothetical protein